MSDDLTTIATLVRQNGQGNLADKLDKIAAEHATLEAALAEARELVGALVPPEQLDGWTLSTFQARYLHTGRYTVFTYYNIDRDDIARGHAWLKNHGEGQ